MFSSVSSRPLLSIWYSFVAPPSESQIPDPAVTSSDPYNDRLSVIRRTSGIRMRWLVRTCKLQVMHTIVSK